MNATLLTAIIVTYLLGSISSAIIVCRTAGLPDPRENGSGNPGATNVFRVGGGVAAALVLIFDVLKGMLPVWLAYQLGQSTFYHNIYHENISPFYLGILAIAACLGHIYPIFSHFRGGRGVATAFGAIAPIGWDIAGLLSGTWIITTLISGYSSLGAVVSALIAPFYVWIFRPELTFPVSMLSCLILIRHHDNIQRLWRGQENQIWRRSNKKPTNSIQKKEQ